MFQISSLLQYGTLRWQTAARGDLGREESSVTCAVCPSLRTCQVALGCGGV